MSLTLPLADLRTTDRPRVGGKAANLGALLRAGLPAPKGFVVTTEAFRRFQAACPESEALLVALEALAPEEIERGAALAARMRAQLAATPVPPEVEAAVRAAFERLWPGAAGALVAVRSSATAEDLPGASFAGQQDTFLNVRAPGELADRLRACWGSLFTDRAVLYRAKNRIAHRTAVMAVIVQEMALAQRAGVLFTADPLTGDRGRVVVEGVAGSGEALASGRAAPERAVLDKRTGRRLEEAVGPLLDDRLLADLLALARRAETLLGAPQDIEWAFDGARLFLLQSRPITALPVKTFEDRQVWTRSNVGEVLPDVVTPLTWSIVNDFLKILLDGSLGRLGVRFEGHPIVTRIAGRVYFNANLFVAFLRSFPGMRRVKLTDIFGGDEDRLAEAGWIRFEPGDLPDLQVRPWRVLLHLPLFLVWLLGHTPRRGERFLADMRRGLDVMQRTELSSLSDAALFARVRAFRTSMSEQADAVFAAGAGIGYFGPLRHICRRWLGDESGALANRLLTGVGGMESAEAGIDLWRLAACARARPAVEAAILAGAPWPEITGGAEGAAFLDRWQRFMDRHGHHARGEIELLNARWRESPDYALDLVRSYLRGMRDAPSDASDPLRAIERRAAEREALVADCRRRLRNPLKRLVFDRARRGVQRGLVFRENVKSQAVRLIAEMRRAALDLGERFVRRGLLAEREEVFFLYLEELSALVAGEAPADLAERIARRRAEHAVNLTLSPPSVVVGRFDPLAAVAPRRDDRAKVLRGLAVSAGTAEGPARVVLRADAEARVLPGEILVAPFTDPGWTPYFLPAAGIVMDLGGMLSHGSIVAREYGIPAVVNVGRATQTIRTGQRVRVEGDTGRVVLLGE